MKKLRSFVYLDNYKMYSISSQLFEGLTEYIVRTERTNKKEEENQNGPFGSGKTLADIIEKDTNQTEKKFLHDFSYNLFEDKLMEENRVLEINSENLKEAAFKINNFNFIKITGNIIFNDLKIVGDTIKNFNKIGEALGFITQKTEYDEELLKLKESVSNIKDRNEKAKASAMLKSSTNFKKVLLDQGLLQDDEYLKHLAFVLEYGYNQQFEVQVPLGYDSGGFHLFSAQLKRENLKEDEFTIIKKYSRETEKEFTLFGILTQRLTSEYKEKIFNDLKESRGEDEFANIKVAISHIVSKLTNLEKEFSGKLNYEYIIDPIALYLEI